MIVAIFYLVIQITEVANSVIQEVKYKLWFKWGNLSPTSVMLNEIHFSDFHIFLDFLK